MFCFLFFNVKDECYYLEQNKISKKINTFHLTKIYTLIRISNRIHKRTDVRWQIG